MSDKRQKNQLELAFDGEDRGEAPKSLAGGTESLAAKLFQKLRQLVNGHPVHRGASFVGPDSSQRLLAVFPLADFLHQRFANGRAFFPALKLKVNLERGG